MPSNSKQEALEQTLCADRISSPEAFPQPLFDEHLDAPLDRQEPFPYIARFTCLSVHLTETKLQVMAPL